MKHPPSSFVTGTSIWHSMHYQPDSPPRLRLEQKVRNDLSGESVVP